jgi:hypothetical protein
VSFTYTEAPATVDLDFCRFHTGDVISDESLLSDELLTSLITLTGSKEGAVIAGIEHKIDRVNQPNFRADWLQMTSDEYVKALERQLARKKIDLGVGGGGTVVSESSPVYRADSEQTEVPDYSAGV